jgi:hypothetical protein
LINAAARKARALVREFGEARAARSRRPPPIRFTEAESESPTVYYLCPDIDVPTGGVRNIYRQVDVLNAAGVDASVMHSATGFRCSWFEHTTRVTSAPRVTLTPYDRLVLPEYYGPGLSLLDPAIRKVIFNQGPYLTYVGVDFEQTQPGAPYAGVDGIESMWTVSHDGAALLRHTFPDLPVAVTRVVVDGDLFRPPDSPAGRRIAYMPRRRPEERDLVLHTLRARGALDGWELVPIHGVDEVGTARLLRSCSVFLAFGEREGFGLPPAEAMASGCYVVGFTGNGGRDYFDPDICTPVPDNDMLAYVKAVEDVLRRYEADPDDVVKSGLLASERVLNRYHEAGLREDLLAALELNANA